MSVRSICRALGLALLSAGLAGAAGGAFAQAPAKGRAGCCSGPQKKKAARPHKPKVERLACRLGTEDQHARIAVELFDGKVNRFAYYSKWKPRTCSMEVERDDAFSKWEDSGNVTVVTLNEDKGAFLIDHERSRIKFIFREIDRMRYCGMDGKVSGSLTVFRGKPQCALEGVMDRGEDAMVDSGGAPAPRPALTAGERSR